MDLTESVYASELAKALLEVGLGLVTELLCQLGEALLGFVTLPFLLSKLLPEPLFLLEGDVGAVALLGDSRVVVLRVGAMVVLPIN